MPKERADRRGDELARLDRAFEDMRSQLAALVSRVRDSVDQLGDISSGLRDASAEATQEARTQESRVEESLAELLAVSTSAAGIDSTVEALLPTGQRAANSVAQLDRGIVEIARSTEELHANVDGSASTVIQLAHAASEIARSARQLGELTAGASDSLTVLDEAAARIEERADFARSSTDEAMSRAHTGLERIDDTIRGMRELREGFDQIESEVSGLSNESQQIGAIIEVIDSIVDETGLLSLNAAIIAAQAGEQGRAFSVVAESIGLLAKRTAGSTREIADGIHRVQRKITTAADAVSAGSDRVQNSVKATKALRSLFEGIVEGCAEAAGAGKEIEAAAQRQTLDVSNTRHAVAQVESLVSEISRATGEQDEGCTQVIAAVDQMRDFCTQVAASTRGHAAESNQIREMVDSLAEGIAQIMQATNQQRENTAEVGRALREVLEASSRERDRADVLERSLEGLGKRTQLLGQEIGIFRT
ncbi:MAG: methyl-accepting chemotaxis protein [Myxococcota bacterium]